MRSLRRCEGIRERCAKSRRDRLRRAVAVGLAGLGAAYFGTFAVRSASAADCVWTGSFNDLWSNPANWVDGNVPLTIADQATISSGTVNLDQSLSIGALTLSGNITGTNDLSIAGLMAWSGGSLAGAATTYANGGINISGTDKIIDTRAVVSSGAGTWSAGNITLSNGALLRNLVTGTFKTSFDGSIIASGATSQSFVNEGVFEKTAGLGGTNATLISTIFSSSGTVRVSGGNLALSGGGSATGTFELASGAALVLKNDYLFGSTSSITGAGGVTVDGGTTTIQGAYSITGATALNTGTLAIPGPISTKDLALSGGLLTGSGTVTASGAVTWSGTVLQVGQILANGTLDISGGDRSLTGTRLTSAGSGTWSAGNIFFSSGAVFLNSGTLSVSVNGSTMTSGSNAGYVSNTGLLDRSGGGGTTFNTVFYNSGTTRVSAGTLNISGGGSATGSFEVFSGARLRFTSDYTLASGSRVSGSGTTEFAGGNTTIAGTYDMTGGRTEIYGGYNDFSGTITSIGSVLYLGSGIAAISAPSISANELQQEGGGIDGTGTITFNGLMTWDAGPQKGSGVTIAAGGLKLQGGSKSLEGRTLINAVGSSGTWSAGDLLGFGSAILRNDGTLTNTYDGNFTPANGSPQFYNTGSFIKSGGTGTTNFGVALNNTGTVRVDSGSVFLSSGSSVGNFDLTGGTIELGGYTLGSGASITGTNKAKFTGSVTVSGPVTAKVVEQTAGTLTGAGTISIENYSWKGGTLTGGGTTLITSTADLSGSSMYLDSRTLSIGSGATATWSAGTIYASGTGQIANGGTFNNSFDATILLANGTPQFNNTGLFIKSGGTATTSIGIALNNTGTVRVDSGNVYLSNGSSAGNFDLTGGTVELAGYTLASGASITGTNKAKITGGAIVTGPVTAKVIEQTAGTLSGAGTLSVEDFSWKGGIQSGGGTTLITSTGDLSGSSLHLDSRTLAIGPTATAIWSSGTLYTSGTGLIQNAGTFNNNFDATILLASGAPQFNNSGLFIKSGGTGTTSIGIALNNTGTVRVDSGNIYLSNGSSAGNFDLTGGTIELAGYTLASGANITGTNKAKIIGGVIVSGPASAKVVEQTAGNLSGAGTFAIENFTWKGGTQSGNGTTAVTSTADLSADVYLDGRTLAIGSGATATWSAGTIYGANGGRIANSGTLVTNFDGTAQFQIGATPSIDNQGQFQKAAGTNATTIAIAFNNSGTATISSGSLRLVGGGTGGGNFVIASGAVLEFAGDYSLSNAGITGLGKARLTAGNLSVDANSTAAYVEQVAGTIIGSADLAVANYDWQGGSLAGNGSLSVTASGTLNAASKPITGRTLRILSGATAAWGTGDFVLSSGASIVNTGTMNVTVNGATQTSGSNAGYVSNTGLLDRSGGGGTTFNTVFYNSGTTRVSAGTLNISGGGSASGSFEVFSGARLRFTSDYTLAAGSRVSGSGTTEFAGGNTTIAGTYDMTGGRTEVYGGYNDFSGTITSIGSVLYLGSGFAAISAPSISANELQQEGGGIDGTGTITFNGLMTWDAGPQKGSGVTIAAGGLKLQGGGKSLEGRTLINAVGSTGTWSSGDISGFWAGMLRNDGTLTNTYDGNFTLANGTPQFLNNGLFVKSTGTGTTSFGVAFNNTGTVRVDSGSIYLSSGIGTGNFDLTGGTIELGGYTLASGASITGTNKAKITGTVSIMGTATAKVVEQTAGTLTGTGTLSIENYSWKGGTLTGGGTTLITATADLSGSSMNLDSRTVGIASGATATWSAGTIYGSGTGQIANAGTFNNSFDATILLANGTPQFNNTGLFIKSGGAGTTSIGIALNNTGTVRVSTGSIYLSSGSSAGNFDLTGGIVELAGYTLASGATITGANKALVSGTLTVTGTASANLLELASSGQILGTGNLAVQHFTWSGGKLGDTGVVTVTSDAALIGAGKELNGRTLRIAPGAVATWSAGDITGYPGSIIDNTGTFRAACDANFFYAQSQSAAFNNSGLFVKTASTGTSTIGILFNNSGTARVESGVLTLSGGGSSNGVFDLAGGNLDLSGGYVLSGGTTITGTNKARIIGDISTSGVSSAQIVEHSAGNVGGAGTLSVDNYTWTGGTLAGTGATVINSSISLSGGLKSIDGRTLRIAGGATALWSAGDVRAGGGGLLENLGTFQAACDQSIFLGDGAPPAFSNKQLFVKSAGTGTTSLNVPFYNSGTVSVQAGSLFLGGGGSATGSFDLSGGTLELSGGYVLASGASITGASKAKITGNMSVSGPASAKIVEQSTGTASGAGTFTIDNFTWKGGTLGGNGITLISTTADLSGSAMYLDGRTLSVGPGATATWSAGTIYGLNGGRISNNGTLIASFDGTATFQTGTPAAIDNASQFVKSGGTGIASIAIQFNNSGTAAISSGTLRLVGTGSASGNFAIASGAMVDLAYDYALSGAQFTGAGTARLTGGVLGVNSDSTAARFEQFGGTIGGPAKFTADTMWWKSGSMSGSGTTAAGTSLTINGADMNLIARTLKIEAGATANWQAGDIRVSSAGTLVNAGTFNIVCPDPISYIRTDGTEAFIRNSGIFRKSIGTNLAAFPGVTLDNTGTVEVLSGTLNVAATQFDPATGTLLGGTWNVSSGGVLDLGGGPGISINLANVTLDGATASFPKINDVADNRGTLVLKDGRQLFTGTTFVNSGTVSVDAASAVNFGNLLTNTGAFSSSGATSANFIRNNGGTLTQSGSMSIGAEFANSAPAVSDISGSQTWAPGAHLIVNGGTVTLRSDTGSTSTANVILDANGGTTELRSAQHLNRLNLGAAIVRLVTGSAPMLHVSSYNPSQTGTTWDGQLDLGNGSAILEYPAGFSILGIISSQLKSGYDPAASSHWNGNGIVTSAGRSDSGKAIGYAESSFVLGAGNTWRGETLGGPAILLRYTIAGDSNLDGKVDFTDLVAVAQHYNQTNQIWTGGDFNYDGKVDFADLVAVAQHYNQALAAPAVPGNSALFQTDLERAFTSVPEPSMLGLAGLGLLMLGRRRRGPR